MLLVPRITSYTPEHAVCRYPVIWDDMKGHAEMSVVFTYDRPKAEDMAEAWRDWGWTVNIGGPAYDDQGDEFIVGKYTKQGVTITHRGCNRECSWCYVPKREGKIRLLDIKAGYILNDNNILACPREHQRKVFEMLRTQKHVSLRGGLDARLLTDWALDEIRSLHLDSLFLAYDSKDNKASIPAIIKCRKAGIPQDKIRCYVMIGNWETMEQSEERCLEVLHNGGMPFAQLYDGIETNQLKEWKALARKWSRPAIYRQYLNIPRPPVEAEGGKQ